MPNLINEMHTYPFLLQLKEIKKKKFKVTNQLLNTKPISIMFKIKFTYYYLVITRKDLVITRKLYRYYEKRSRYYKKRSRKNEKIIS